MFKLFIFKLFVFFGLIAALFLTTCTVKNPNTLLTYTVTFNNYGGNNVPSQSITSGKMATKPSDVTRDCFDQLIDWVTEDDVSYNFSNAVTNDLILFSKWDEFVVPQTNNDGKYEIICWEQLQWIAGERAETNERTNRLGYDYILTKDIVFPKPGKNGFPEYGFVPIGFNSSLDAESEYGNEPFTGTFDGAGFSISNFFINTEHTYWGKEGDERKIGFRYIGLFGKIKGNSFNDVVVKDLTLNISYIKGKMHVGGLIAYLEKGIVSNVAVLGGQLEGDNNVGGLVGYMEGGNNKLIGYSTGNVSGNDNVGGLVGQAGVLNQEKNIVLGYATGNVSGNDNVGGLVGYNVSDVTGYATGTVSGNSVVGGLTGNNQYNPNVIGYATGTVSGSDTVGGLIGNPTSRLWGYWDQTSTKQKYADGVHKTTNSDGIVTNLDGIVVARGISATKNIYYNNTNNGKWEDRKATLPYDDDVEIFNNENFTNRFELSQDDHTWPKLKGFALPQPKVYADDGSYTVIVNFN